MNEFWKAICELFTPSEQTKYNMTASMMQMEGYTDLDIELELGSYPKEESDGAES